MFSKNGSYPKPETDGTEGWVEVPDAPEVPEGKELAWLNGEWVVRDPKPVDRPGYQWNWAHEARSWVECPYLVMIDLDLASIINGPDGELLVAEVSMPSLASMPFIISDESTK